jgi:hypothetical protein
MHELGLESYISFGSKDIRLKMAGYVLGMYTRYDYAEVIKCKWTWNQSGCLQWSM